MPSRCFSSQLLSASACVTNDKALWELSSKTSGGHHDVFQSLSLSKISSYIYYIESLSSSWIEEILKHCLQWVREEYRHSLHYFAKESLLFHILLHIVPLGIHQREKWNWNFWHVASLISQNLKLVCLGMTKYESDTISSSFFCLVNFWMLKLLPLTVEIEKWLDFC